MKRKTFLASLLGMLALPFTISAKKKEEPKDWIIRESYRVEEPFLPNQNLEYRIEIGDMQAKTRLLANVEKQITSWETGSFFNGKPIRERHFMIVIKPIKK